MIINTGSKTDTVQYYSDWLLKRFDIQAADGVVVVWRIEILEIMTQENYKKHNPNDLMILGNLKPTDEIQQSSQKSFLENNIQQKMF